MTRTEHQFTMMSVKSENITKQKKMENFYSDLGPNTQSMNEKIQNNTRIIFDKVSYNLSANKFYR